MDEIELKIEKNIPVPPESFSSRMKKALTKMEVGDSISVPFSHGANTYFEVARLSSVNKWKFKRKKESDGIRFWRIK